MRTTIVRLNPTDPEPHLIADAAARIKNGELVAFPTETVYGLGADALNPDAVASIYAAKGRPAWNPVISHVATIDGARALTRHWPETAQRLAEAFWPGPLTLVLQKHERVPDVSTAGRDAVAIRIPAHPVALALIHAVGGPVAAPSANRFTQISPTTAAHVAASLGDRVHCILDGGSCWVGIESTVVDLTGPVPTILRPGMISQAQIQAVLGITVVVAAAVNSPHDGDTERALAPGSADRHYAPDADVWLFSPESVDEITRALSNRTDVVHSPGDGPTLQPVTALLLTTVLALAPSDHIVQMPQDAAAYARILYRELHTADTAGASLIVIENPPDTDEWRAVRDRLARASHA